MKASKLFPAQRLALFLAVALLLPSTLSRAAASDENWDAQFGLPGTTNNILALATNNGTLVIGGYGNPTTNTTLSLWDGNQWSTLGVFSNGISPAYIYDTAYLGGTLYAAGMFSSVNGTAASGLASWNGSAWSSVGGFNGSGLCLAASGGGIYVGGIFTMLDSSSVTMTNIGYWDGSAWHAVGGGLGVPAAAYVRTVAVGGGSLYAGGSFTNSGSQAVTNLAVWNGSVWTAVGGGANNIVDGLAFSGGNLYAAGGFTQVGSTTADYVAEWNGSIWSALGNGLGGGANSVAVFSNLVCVAGGFTTAGVVAATNFAVWNGTSWSAAGNGLSTTGLRVISNGTNVYVGGGFGVAGNVYVGGVASWDGNNWRGLGTSGRINGLQSSAFAFANDGVNLYAGGLFNYAGQTNAYYVARFDGTNWYSLGSGIGPVGGTTIVRALAFSSNNLYAGGSFSTAGGVSAANMARWDGANWNALGSGPGGVVASILVGTNGIYAAGAVTSGSTYNSPFFEVWNGASWQSPLGLPGMFDSLDTYFSDPNIGMDALASMGTNIFIGGHFILEEYANFPSGYTVCSNIMRFDGTYARPMGVGFNSNVVAMAVLGTNLYAAGLFTNTGSIAASHIAMWNGTAWSAVGSGVVGTGTVSSLAALDDYVYAGGTFTNIGGVAASRIARWDGTNWYALGSGVGPNKSPTSVLGLASFGADLYAGGSFMTAGVNASYYVGRWNDQINFDIPQLLNPVWLGAGQFQMELNGLAGLTNIVQATTNFSSWVPVLTNMTGIYEFTDTSASNYSYRFYRAKLGP